jgi:hypothetical protein
MVIRFQKGGMTATYQGVKVVTDCRSLSTGIDLIGENGVIVASFTPEELKKKVSDSVRKHGVRKFALLVDSKTNKKMMDLFLINPSIITKYWDSLLSLNTTGKIELCLRDTKHSRLILNLYADKISNFVSKSQIVYAEGVNNGTKAEAVVFPNSGKKKNRLVDGYLLKRTKNGKSYRFSIQLKCSMNRANTNGIVKF